MPRMCIGQLSDVGVSVCLGCCVFALACLTLSLRGSDWPVACFRVAWLISADCLGRALSGIRCRAGAVRRGHFGACSGVAAGRG